MTEAVRAATREWWRGAVIYQIYPRSFCDSNGDGIGDLPGITLRLDYIARLGVDAIWLSPFQKSPMKDFGYDVSDYCDVDPMFGTLDDFRALLERAHGLGLRVIIDQVLSHSSDQHPWFIESRASRSNPKADWYVWAEPKPDGTPPNNWLSVFGGSAWQWDTRRRQYYLHNFLAEQPDLNFHNPAVQDALLETVRFWLDLGVDGLRLDAINFCFHDAELRDNPPLGEPDGINPTVPVFSTYAWQQHLYDRSRPEALGFLQRLRSLVARYPDAMTVGEVGDESGMLMVAAYSRGGDKLHMGYCFELLTERRDARYLHGVIERFEAVAEDGWACWPLSNHDCTRLATRWGGSQPSPAQLRLAAALQLSLRGTPCLYQGDELGLPEAVLDFADLQDPVGKVMWPESRGRDGCRTPFPWRADAPNQGFSDAPTSARPWLPVAETHRALAADLQESAPDSLLAHYRHLLRWRRGHPALLEGALTLLPVHDQVLAWLRQSGEECVLCVLNLGDSAVDWPLPAGLSCPVVLAESGAHGVRVGEDVQGETLLHCEPWGVLFARLA